MKCSYCQKRAGWLRKTCVDCRRLLDIYNQHRGQLALIQFLDLFIETGLSRETIEAFMNADPHGDGSVKDQITADMSSELLAAMGIPVKQTAQDVKQLREKDNWQRMGARTEE